VRVVETCDNIRKDIEEKKYIGLSFYDIVYDSDSCQNFEMAIMDLEVSR
jgi:hypothetical protein